MTPSELRAARASLGLSQRALAERIGVARLTVIRWEAGTWPITRRTELAIRSLRPLRQGRGGATERVL